MNIYQNCPFCEFGQYNRALMFRIVGDLSRSELRELLKLKKEGRLFRDDENENY